MLLGAAAAVAGALALRVYLQYRAWQRRFPKPPRLPIAGRPDVEAWGDGCYFTWIGHSTVLMQLFGVRILTDPVFSAQVGVRLGPLCVGPRRFTDPALTADDLAGRVDVVLLSHAHLDHLDMPSLRRLADRRVTVVTAAGTARLLRRLPFAAVHELAPGQALTLPGGVRVTAVPVRHWGARFPWNRHYGWNGYLIEKESPHGRPVRILFAGDTAYTDAFATVATPLPPDVVCMPIGAYAPDAFQRAHCTPEQAWRMFLDTQGEWLIPMHWRTFVLSQEPVEEPLSRLLAAAGHEAGRIVIRCQGETFQLPAAAARATTENR
ncbi:Tat pathway signal protein [Alicyclobacillus cellulosilyticus]|uniref:Tat pathway signal protein n=1 Tax=Alicyclobacillus cellulosilyticus TaxID=1003997 RepID=A0A917NJN2_9BACL|nr:Tat pathway signal protein [Alicyclobacillus cellulosilyticus]